MQQFIRTCQPEQVIQEVTVDYYKTENFIPSFEAAYPDKFNKMDYMGAPATFQPQHSDCCLHFYRFSSWARVWFGLLVKMPWTQTVC